MQIYFQRSKVRYITCTKRGRKGWGTSASIVKIKNINDNGDIFVVTRECLQENFLSLSRSNFFKQSIHILLFGNIIMSTRLIFKDYLTGVLFVYRWHRLTEINLYEKLVNEMNLTT